MSKRIFLSLFGVLIVFSLLLAACKPAAPAGTGVEIDKNATVEIWIDAAREESAGKFIDKYPDKGKLVTLTTTDYGQLPQKILFWNNVGGGWPDASFAGPQIVPLINDAAHSYLGDLKPLYPKKSSMASRLAPFRTVGMAISCTACETTWHSSSRGTTPPR